MKSNRDVIATVITELKAVNFVDGFENTVKQRIRNALNENNPGQGKVFWNHVCTNPARALEPCFDNDESLFDEYVEFEKHARENGFQMPEWGTYGT